MRRQKRKNTRPSKKNGPTHQQASATPEAPTRRDFFVKIRNDVIAAAVVGVAGWYLVDEVRATIQGGDLTRIGNGIPTIVQIHDPQCPKCVALQQETRDALSNFEDGKLQYLVANIRTVEGKMLATSHGVGHVTLLLFDRQGRKLNTLVGSNTSRYLTEMFRGHLSRSTKS